MQWSLILSALSTAIGAATLYPLLELIVKKARRVKKLEIRRAQHDLKPANSQLAWDKTSVLNSIVANYHLIRGTLFPRLKKAFDQYGDTYKSSVLGQKLIFTKSADNIKHILATRFADFDTATTLREPFKPLVGKGIFVLDGHDWKEARPMYRDLFSKARVAFDVEQHEDLFQLLNRHMPTNGTSFDLQPLLSKLFIDFSTEWTLGKRNGFFVDQQSPEDKALIDGLLFAKTTIAWLSRMGSWAAKVLSPTKFPKACTDVKSIVQKHVDNALEDNCKATEKGMTLVDSERAAGRKAVLLHQLMHYTQDPELLRDTCTSMLLAGSEAVVSTIVATFWLLARDPEVYQRLRRAIIDECGTKVPTYEQLRQITYLRNVQYEAMRLLPSVPINARIANRDTWLPSGGGRDGTHGVPINKGNVIVFSTWEAHRQKAIFGADAEEFRPDRWDSMPKDVFGFFGFNVGPRACPGRHFGTAQATFFLARTCQSYSAMWSEDKRPWVEQLSFNMLNRNGVHLSLRPSQINDANWD